MRVLVIGGTAFFGKAIVRAMLDRGHEVTIFSRGRERPDFWGEVAHIAGDRFDRDAFHEALAGREFDAVVDNIAFTAADVQSAVDLFRGRTHRYLFTSSGAVYGTRPDVVDPRREADVEHGATADLGDYARGKVEGERVLLEQEGLPYTIIRPPVVVGADDPLQRGWFYIQRVADGGPVLLANGGVQRVRFAYSEDLGESFALALENPHAAYRAFNVAQREIPTVATLVRMAAESLGSDAPIVPIGPGTSAPEGLDYQEPWEFTRGGFLDITRAETELDYDPRPIADWWPETVRYYRERYQGDDSPGYGQRAAEVAWGRGLLDG